MCFPVYLTYVSTTALLISLGFSGNAAVNAYYIGRWSDGLGRQLDAQESLSKKIKAQLEKLDSQLEHLHDHVERRERERQNAALEKEEFGEGGRDAYGRKVYGDSRKDK